MRILFISGELIGSAIIHRLVKEGHEVKLYIDHEDRKNCLDGFVEKTPNWVNELEWVGKDGLIVFDDVIFEGAQDRLREQGYSVMGGNALGDKLENDRQFFQEILEQNGVNTLPSYAFDSAAEAIDFVKNNGGKWVVKQDSHIGMLNYVGKKDDSEDVIDILKSYEKKNIHSIQLQKKVVGVEIGVARYFNGNDWVSPIEINLEHKSLCNGDIGPLTAEMGTLIWYEEDENLPLYAQTLKKLKNHLSDINYKGDIDVNCIVNEDGIWPLEATMRFGTPSTEVQCELHKSSWGEFMKSIADGEPYALEYKKGYGVVVSVAVPPFPYAPEFFENSKLETSQGLHVYFTDKLTAGERNQIHFEEVASKTDNEGVQKYYLAGKHGYALYVTGHGTTVEQARTNAYDVINKLLIPKMFYRTDIGNKFIREDEQKLKKWGWI